MRRLGAILSMAAMLAPAMAVGNVATIVPVEEVRPLPPAAWNWGRFDPRVPYSHRSSQRQRRKLRRRGGR